MKTLMSLVMSLLLLCSCQGETNYQSQTNQKELELLKKQEPIPVEPEPKGYVLLHCPTLDCVTNYDDLLEYPVYEGQDNKWIDTTGRYVEKGNPYQEGNPFCGEFKEIDILSKKWKTSTRFFGKEIVNQPVTENEIQKCVNLIKKNYPKYPKFTILKKFKIHMAEGPDANYIGKCFVLETQIKMVKETFNKPCTHCDGKGRGGNVGVGINKTCWNCGGIGYIENKIYEDVPNHDLWIIDGVHEIDCYLNLTSGDGVAHDRTKMVRSDYSIALPALKSMLSKI